LANVTWSRAQTQDGSILLKFSLETRLESESFEPLTNFLLFVVQTLWPKINKIINYLIMGLITNFVVETTPLIDVTYKQPKTKKFFHSKHEDLLSLLRV